MEIVCDILIKSVDIRTESNVHRVYFIKYPECFFLDKNVRKWFEEKVNTDSYYTRALDFLKNFNYFFESCHSR